MNPFLLKPEFQKCQRTIIFCENCMNITYERYDDYRDESFCQECGFVTQQGVFDNDGVKVSFNRAISEQAIKDHIGHCILDEEYFKLIKSDKSD